VNLDAYAELEKTLPPILSRTEVPKLTGGLISAGRLANLDCLGLGPRRITLGRKVGYTRADFIAWMRARGGQIVPEQEL
jgi:hypothetical protein